MNQGSASGSLLAFFIGYSTPFRLPLPATTAPRPLIKEFSVGVPSTIVGPRSAVRADITGALHATIQGASEATSPLKRDDLEATQSEEATDAIHWPYDWRKHWYGVGFERDFPKGEKPFGVTIFDEPLVLFRDGDGILHCVSDFCPHRASKLSEGMVTDGNIECLYHGWQFDGKTGSCVHIPQLREDAKVPRTANLRVYPLAIREGVVYVWMGDDPWGEGAKDILPVPCTEDDLDKTEPSFRFQFVYDLPYDWSYLAENALDPAHVFFSHHGTESGGNRAAAGPIRFEMLKEDSKSPSARGFSAEVLNLHFTKKGAPRRTTYHFEAPGVIRMRVENGYVAGESENETRKPGMLVGLTVHATPLGRGRSRVLFDTYSMNAPALLKFLIRMKPSFLIQLNSCKFVEQDMGQICAQEDHVARTGQSLSKSFLPIMGSDKLVVELRKWLDHVGHGMPHYTGWKTSKLPAEHLSDHEISSSSKYRAKQSRFYNHVVLSECTRKALKSVIRVKRISLATAGILASTAALLISCTAGAVAPIAAADASATAVGGLFKRGWLGIATAVGGAVALGVGAAAQKLEGCFYENFERHPVLE